MRQDGQHVRKCVDVAFCVYGSQFGVSYKNEDKSCDRELPHWEQVIRQEAWNSGALETDPTLLPLNKSELDYKKKKKRSCGFYYYFLSELCIYSISFFSDF